MTMEIPVGRSHVTLVDDDDYENLSQFTWHPFDDKGLTIYARTRLSGETAWTRIHTLITGWKFVDHVDRNGLNNQRSNLRPAEAEQ